MTLDENELAKILRKFTEWHDDADDAARAAIAWFGERMEQLEANHASEVKELTHTIHTKVPALEAAMVTQGGHIAAQHRAISDLLTKLQHADVLVGQAVREEREAILLMLESLHISPFSRCEEAERAIQTRCLSAIRARGKEQVDTLAKGCSVLGHGK